MKIVLDYFKDKFSVREINVSEIKPFSHAEVVIYCDEPLSRTNGEIERKVESYLSKKLASLSIKAEWDNSSVCYKLQDNKSCSYPRISKLIMGINFSFNF